MEEKGVQRTAEYDVHEETTVDETRAVEEFVVLCLAGVFVFRGRRGERAALVDVEDLLCDILQDSRSALLLWRIERGTNIVIAIHEHQKCTARRGHEKEPPIGKHIVPQAASAILPPDFVYSAVRAPV